MNRTNPNPVEVAYIGDFDGSPLPDTLVVATDTDYVKVCAALARVEDMPATVWVRKKNYHAWLRNFLEQTCIPAVFSEKTARILLAEQWRVSLPEWLTDALVVQDKLLSVAVDADAPASFENRILFHFLGGAFENQKCGPGDLAALATRLAEPESTYSLKQYGSLRMALRAKCEGWVHAAVEPWAEKLIPLLVNEAALLWKELTCLALLHGYPEALLEFVIPTDRRPVLRNFPVSALDGMALHPEGVDEAVTQMTLYFRDIADEVSSLAAFQMVLAYVSGRTRQEFQQMRALLDRGRFEVDMKTIQAFQDRFKQCPGLSEGQLRSLRLYVVPNSPRLQESEEVWDGRQWLAWAVEEYLPYRHWQVARKHYDSAVEQTVQAFTDWYIAEYLAVHHDPDLSLVYGLDSLAPPNEAPGLTLLLIIDCLPVSFFPLLEGALREAGFNRHALGYRFAPLPTATAYSKPRLVRGDWLLDGKDYRKLLQERSDSAWGGKPILYVSTLKELEALPPPKSGAVVALNLLGADEIMHRCLESDNLTYEEELERFFGRVADGITGFLETGHYDKEQIALHVITDHGAACILEDERRTLDSSVMAALFADEKHRFARIPKSEAYKTPANLWNLGYRFEDPFAPQETVFFLPRGHNTVKPQKKASSYAHGGVTPEEVITPCALYKLTKAQWVKPVARFINLTQDASSGHARFYIQRVVTIEIDIQNPNPVEVRLVRASVTRPECDLRDVALATIPGEKRGVVRLECFFQRKALGEQDMEIEVVYEIGIETKTLALTLKSDFVSALSGGFSIKDL
ncbi:MAG: hypothetical protein GXY07_20420 [Candidatus Hydrogenedentes bacterium]|nr:hypothetical protein [Candidatus Hydrogenedentota bacterium]